MIDEIVLIGRISKKLKDKFDGLKSEQVNKLDVALVDFDKQSTEQVSKRIDDLDADLNGRADVLIDGLNNEAATKTNSILVQVMQYGRDKVDAFINVLTGDAKQAISDIKAEGDRQVAKVSEGVKKGDKGDKGDKGKDGKDGDDGVSIKNISQPVRGEMVIETTDGSEYNITLPVGPKGRSGGGGSGLGTIQEFYNGVANFPVVGKGQVTYFDTSKTPYEIYLWTGSAYAQAGGGGGVTTDTYKNPVYTYTGDNLTRIDYSTGEYQVNNYNVNYDVSTIYVTTETGTTIFTFNYNIDGSLLSVVES